MNSLKSPITGLECNKTMEIPVLKIINAYNKQFSIDTSSYFHGLDHISIYECNQTGYQFYTPFDIDGDGIFYEKLQQWEGYYEDWKWEHQVVFESLEGHEKILEIGSGAGGFLRKMTKEGFDIHGLELNKQAVQECKKDGLNVYYQSIQDHSNEKQEMYDLICSFQVLEHISDVKSFIQSSLNCLKKGGKMIISVPNNNGFLQLEFNALNCPPHHMGLWKKQSLEKLNTIFDIDLDCILFSPLEKKHIPFFKGNVVRNWKKRFPFLPYKALLLFFKLTNRTFSNESKALTIQAHYIKK